MVLSILLLTSLIGLFFWLFQWQRERSRPRRPSGRFDYSEGRYRRRLLAQSRRDYPSQSESWHLRRVERWLEQKKQQW